MTLARDLFAEDEWRILWWETARRLDGHSAFPEDAEDLSLLAHACEATVRHWNSALRQRLRPVAERAMEHPLLGTPELAQEMQLLRGFLHECTNPLHGMERELGPWSPDHAVAGGDQELLQVAQRAAGRSLAELGQDASRSMMVRVDISWVRLTRVGREGVGYRPLSQRLSELNRALADERLRPAVLDGLGQVHLIVESIDELRRSRRVLDQSGFDARCGPWIAGLNRADKVKTLVDLEVAYHSDGQVAWEDWWVGQHGNNRQAPSFDDYISFIDYDLGSSELPPLTRDDSRLFIRGVPSAMVPIAQGVVEYHGFRIIDVVG